MALPENIYNLVYIVNYYFIAISEGPLCPFVKPSHVQIFGFFTRHEYIVSKIGADHVSRKNEKRGCNERAKMFVT